ncbi:histone-lysine N-methyltransferase SETMAR [Plakobranchus ocellatus]|uniref:Histone-lysine N-methyltransferase SETMAR n=1 Tax=Plakobranchus ocellatus TaxID=259542 RepID=A0AAV4BDH5_9GAST|nr:histone-lysine N-methyltransferase SETMAR [Plakobranchus ocellatus]
MTTTTIFGKYGDAVLTNILVHPIITTTLEAVYLCTMSILISINVNLIFYHGQHILQTNLTQQRLQRYGWEILPHSAHSPDLVPSDFHLFGPLKRHLGGMAFETEDDLISELRNWFDNLDVDFFRVGINSLLSRWQKCMDLHGNYVEK